MCLQKGVLLLIVYASKTGHVARFVARLGLKSLPLKDGRETIHEPCLLITYTTGFGQAPPEVIRFVENHRGLVRGVAASGNRNWGANFARAADVLAERYGIKVIHKFELAGTPKDREIIQEALHALSGTEQCATA
ncbi:MAG: class Ib ribonucleoside-diphosphate reductase assembly flavoprotein NrdI [Meiothermus ruber]|nr:class Ib ribonucleoside-diphosphate reductase assembly flavoprotein NrdI [Meiothermus ruber]